LLTALPAGLEPRLDLVALDLAGGAARQVGEGDEADVLRLLEAGELAAALGVEHRDPTSLSGMSSQALGELAAIS
jgi:hypothetical protein